MCKNTEEYSKKYYQEHKEEMHKQMKKAQKKWRLREFIKKLNSNTYVKIPYAKIEKYNIQKNEEGVFY